MSKIKIDTLEKHLWNLVNGYFCFFESSLIQKKVLEGLQGVGGVFNENKTSELHNSEILK